MSVTIFEDDGVDSANITTSTSNGTTFFPYPHTTVPTPNITFYPTPPSYQGYYLVELPVSEMPKKVYFDGRLVVLGIFGSETEVAFAPPNKLIVARADIFRYNNEIKTGNFNISIEYKDWLYHYSCTIGFMGFPECKPGTTIINMALISKVAQ